MNPVQSSIDQKIVNLGYEIRAVVEYGGGQIIHLSRKKYAFLHAFAETGSVEFAAKKAGVRSATCKNWLKDKKVQEFLKECTAMAAKVNGFHYKKWMSRMIDAWEGKVEITAQQLEAGKVLGKTLNYVPKDVQVHNHIENANIRFDFAGKENQNILDSDSSALEPDQNSGSST